MNDDGKSYLKQLEDIKFIMFDICRCTIEGLPKAFDEIKESLERLEKLEKAVEILKNKFHLDIIENGYYDCIDLSYDSVNPDNLPKEEYELLEELMKND